MFNFEQRLQELDRELQTFKEKERMSMNEIKNNVASLSQINTKLEGALSELEVRVQS